MFSATVSHLVSAHEGRDTIVISNTDSVMIKFRQSKWNLDPALGSNGAALDRIDRRLTTVLDDSVYRVRHVTVSGGASPEGSVAFNRELSEKRARSLFGLFDRYNRLPESARTFIFLGRDWEGVLQLAEKDPSVPYREETLELLRKIVGEKRVAGGEEPPRSVERMKNLRGGVPYGYLSRTIFPTVRQSKMVIDYDRILAPEAEEKLRDTIATLRGGGPEMVSLNDVAPCSPLPIALRSEPEPREKKPFYMDIRTNMLYDLVAVPNIGAEFYIGKKWSIGGTWIHAWWNNDRRHRYWRIYGGELNVRRWFGNAAEAKPLTGHHIGIYAQALTYDFQWGGTAYMGGEPGGTIFDRAHFGAGVEYGYSLPVRRRLNIDFSLGVGYIGGRVYEFEPVGDCHIWRATKDRHWLGPTKIEIALVWLIGRGNYNREKGGMK